MRRRNDARLLYAQVNARRADDDRLALPAALRLLSQEKPPANRDVRRWRQRKAVREAR